MEFKRNILFYFGYFLLISAEMLQTIPIVKKGQDIITLTGLISICLFDLIYIIKNKEIRNINKIGIICLTLIISLISYIITQDFTIIKFIILMFSIFYFEFDKIVQWDFKIKLLLIFTVITMYFLGFTETRVFYRIDGTVRYTLGFIHPNTLGFYTMMLVFEYFYINRDKISIRQYVFAIIIFLINWKISDSRTCALIIFAFILYNLINGKWINKLLNNKIIKTLTTYSFLIFSLLSIAIGFIYNSNNPLMIHLNELLSLRPQNYALYLSSYPITILGNNLPDSINGKFLDNAYLLLILKFGIVQYLGYLFLTIKTFHNLYSKKCNYLIVILLLLLLYGLMENMIIKATMNVFILALILPLQEKVREKNER